MTMSKHILKTILFTSLIASTYSTSLVAGGRDAYLGVKLGSLDFDKTVRANTSGIENTGPYAEFDDVSLVGFEMQWFHHTASAFIWGFGWDIMFNDGSFQDGGMLDFDFKLGARFNALKIYGILGIGIQALSEYTAATGPYSGIGVTYDVAESFGVHATYTNRSMTTFVDEYSFDISDDQEYDSSGLLLGVTYKY
jgi:hypothetical protein